MNDFNIRRLFYALAGIERFVMFLFFGATSIIVFVIVEPIILWLGLLLFVEALLSIIASVLNFTISATNNAEHTNIKWKKIVSIVTGILSIGLVSILMILIGENIYRKETHR